MLVKTILLLSAAALLVMAVFCNAIYDWGTACVRRWGWDRIVAIRDGQKYWALPFSKALLILLAAGSLIAAVFIA